MKPVLAHLDRHRRSGDALYVAYEAQYAFAYYHLCNCGGFDGAGPWPFSTGVALNQARAMHSQSRDLIVGSRRIASGEYQQDLGPFLGRSRVWILFADLPEWQTGPFLEYVDKVGRRLDHFTDSGPGGIGASIYLYELQG